MDETVFQVIQLILLVLIFLSVSKPLTKKTRLILKRSVVVTIHFLSKLFPKSKNLIVFGGESGNGFRGNTKYLFLEMNKNDSLQCVWISKNQRVVNEINSLGYQAYKHHSIKGIINQLRAKVIVHSHSINDDFSKTFVGGAISYNTWHGVGLKKVWGANKHTFSYKVIHDQNRIRKFFAMFVVKANLTKKSYVVSTSESVSSYYPETFLVPRENVLELGQVRNDVFFMETEEDKLIPEWIREGKIILYMPTHRSVGKFEKDISLVFNFEKLNAFCEDNGYTFVFKRHMYSQGNVPTSYSNIKDISEQSYDPQLLLKYTDILITDYSSCYTDYLLLDRPVLFFCYDIDLYLTKANQMYFNYFDVTPGPKAYQFNELINYMKESIEEPMKYQKDRSRVLDIFYSPENQQPVLQKQVEYIEKYLL
ncbi:CDP-glycerol glycerophosphotransferase family protein [Oceanobacillus sp. 1P07AA]|uniref:CDP-glycerol glycerophosphotransferase family protein n=1 Tax=Oceanobacillus sp. 1P07AA TaxID=3132293 RepID=UPI0039A55200